MIKRSDPFYKSKAWKTKRATILRRAKYRCRIAARYGKKQEANTVHHIYPYEQYPEYGLCDWNLIAVSENNHNKLHDRKTGELTRVGIDLMRKTKPR